jgi:hypothetical protein
MNPRLLALFPLALGIAGTAVAVPNDGENMSPGSRLAACAVTTVAEPPFSPPVPYSAMAPPGTFWFGTEDLWTALPTDGSWPGLRQKMFWWRPGFDGRTEQKPQLTVVGRRLDGAGSFVRPPPATNASNAGLGGWTMLALTDIPSAGCWEITGSYRGNMVRFNVLIVP